MKNIIRTSVYIYITPLAERICRPSRGLTAVIFATGNLVNPVFGVTSRGVPLKLLKLLGNIRVQFVHCVVTKKIIERVT